MVQHKELPELCLSLNLRRAIQGFLLDMEVSRRSPTTVEAYRIVLSHLADYGESDRWPTVDQLTVNHLRAYLSALQQRPRWFGRRDAAQKPISTSYYETIYRRLKTFFKWLVEEGEAKTNPLSRIQHPKLEKKLIPIVEEADFRKLLQLTNPQGATTRAEQFRCIRDTAALWLLSDTSVRKEGITGISVDDVDLKERKIVVMEKGRKERVLWIGSVTTKALWRYMAERETLAPLTDDLWVSARGEAMQPHWIYLMLKRLGKRCGIANLHTHRFRHTYAVRMIEQQVPLPVLEHMGGWSRIPKTYLDTIGDKAAREFHSRTSPADRIAKGIRGKSPK